MEKSCFRAWKRHGSRRMGSFSLGGNDCTGDGGKPGGSDGRKEDREMRRQEQRGQRRARAR